MVRYFCLFWWNCGFKRQNSFVMFESFPWFCAECAKPAGHSWQFACVWHLANLLIVAPTRFNKKRPSQDGLFLLKNAKEGRKDAPERQSTIMCCTKTKFSWINGVHGEYENTQLEKSQKSQGQDFCRFLLLCIEAEIAPTRKFKPSHLRRFLFSFWDCFILFFHTVT